jgi:hypothetical protein
MTAFEYATGMVSIVIGLAVARVLGGIGSFISARERLAYDWFVAAWCIVVLVNLGGWWIAVWNLLHRQIEIEFSVLLAVTLATAFLYLASYVLIEGRSVGGTQHAGAFVTPGAAFFCCLGAHFAVVVAMIYGFGMNQPREDVIETGFLAAVATAGAAAKGARTRVLHLVIWAALLFALLADNTSRIALSD